jgi:hypothetical protein
MRKLRWGVISTARIGIEKVIPAMQGGKHSTVTAIASRASDFSEGRFSENRDKYPAKRDKCPNRLQN